VFWPKRRIAVTELCFPVTLRTYVVGNAQILTASVAEVALNWTGNTLFLTLVIKTVQMYRALWILSLNIVLTEPVNFSTFGRPNFVMIHPQGGGGLNE